MAARDKSTRHSQCSLCHFFRTAKERHSEAGRRCIAADRVVQPFDPICDRFFLYHLVWCPHKEQALPVGSCLNKQEMMRNGVEEKRWFWRRCINCVQGVLIYRLNLVTQENRSRLLGRSR